MSSQRNPSVRFRKAGSSLRLRSFTYFESIQRSFMANLPSTFVDQYPLRPEEVHDHLLNLLGLVLDSPARRHRDTDGGCHPLAVGLWELRLAQVDSGSLGKRCMAAGSYGYVIVGAGSAGCVLANRLSADPAVACWRRAGRTERGRSVYRWPSPNCFRAATTRTTARPGSRSCRSGRSIGRVQDPWRLSSLIGRRAHVGIALTMTVGQNSAFLAACTELRPHRLGELNEPDRSAPSPVPSTAGCGTGPRTGTCVPSGGDPPDRPPGAYAQRILLDGCRATGVEYRDGAGLNPASDRLPRGDTQRRPLS